MAYTLIVFVLSFFCSLHGAATPLPRPTFEKDSPGPVLINSSAGRGVAASTAILAAMADITSILGEKKLHAARNMYQQSVARKKRGKSFERHSKAFFKRRLFHAGLNWVNGLMASGFDTVSWHTQRTRTGGAEKAVASIGHLTGALARSQAPSAKFVSFRVVSAMLTLLWRLFLTLGSDTMIARDRTLLVAATRGFEVASLWAGVAAKNKNHYGTLAASLTAKGVGAYLPFIANNMVDQQEPTMDIRHAHRSEKVGTVQKDIAGLDLTRGIHLRFIMQTNNLKGAEASASRAFEFIKEKEKPKSIGDGFSHYSSKQWHDYRSPTQVIFDYYKLGKDRQESAEKLRGLLKQAAHATAYRKDEKMWESAEEPLPENVAHTLEQITNFIGPVITNYKGFKDALMSSDYSKAVKSYQVLEPLNQATTRKLILAAFDEHNSLSEMRRMLCNSFISHINAVLAQVGSIEQETLQNKFNNIRLTYDEMEKIVLQSHVHDYYRYRLTDAINQAKHIAEVKGLTW